MKLVPRSFTRIPDSGKGAPVRVERLDGFRNERAYVLLGAPGSGKSTVFRQEAESCDTHFVTARDFVWCDREEWATSTLFLDGLDEMRVGSEDPRKPLDQIRKKLRKLGCPRFRISCRDGAWLGSNDHESLKALTDGKDIPVIRLNPLGIEEIRKVLNEQVGADESQRMLDGAIARGLQGLLENPLTLTLVAKALAGSNWPQHRTEAFAMGCDSLLKESNAEHRGATLAVTSMSAVRRAAERLCAFQLLTGTMGYRRNGDPTDADFLDLSELGDIDPHVLNLALGSRIFESTNAPGQLAPIHRVVAEFLAARYLARLADNGLPVGRILSLVCGFDGHVVSEFSGMTAWLAALRKRSRVQIIEQNPLGVLLQGDVKDFSPDEKVALIDCVAKQPWRRDDYYRLIASGDARLGDLATPDMGSVFRRYLLDPVNDNVGLQATLLVVRSLQYGSAASGLRPELLQIVRNDQWHPQIRFHALGVLCKHPTCEDQGAMDLTTLLQDVADGNVHDEDDELLGLLLDSLYPSILCATDIVRFLKAPKDALLYGRYKSFWYRLPSRELTPQEIGEILDALHADMAEAKARFSGHPMDSDFASKLPKSLLAQYLVSDPTGPDHPRLYDWLELAFNRDPRIRGEKTQIIQDWLSRHPKDFKAVIEHGITHCAKYPQSERLAKRFRRILDGLDSAPMQIAEWLHEQPSIAPDPRIKMALRQLSERGIIPTDRSETVTEQQTETDDEEVSLPEFAKDLGPKRPVGSASPPPERDEEDHVQPWQEEWRERVRAHLETIRSGQCSPSVLDGLACAYFGMWPLVDGEVPTERLRHLLGDESLVNAVLTGLRGAVHRDDIPSPDEVADLVRKDLIHPLAHPYLAGMVEIEHALERPQEILDPRQLRTALAFHFGTPFIDPEPYRANTSDSTDQGSPLWYRQVLESEPELVAEVLVQMARAEIAKGFVLFHVLHKLETSPDHEPVARRACLPLLRSMPVRSNSIQMDGLACLLRAAVLHCDKRDLQGLIDTKLGRSSMHAGQRVYWLMAGLFSSPSTYRSKLVEALSTRETLIPCVVDFAVGSSPLPTWGPPLERLDRDSLECLVQAVGKRFNPLNKGTLQMNGPIFVETLVKHLSRDPSPKASRSLSRLLQSTELEAWWPRVQEGQLQQAAIRRSVSFRYVSTCQLRRTLDNLQPASAADLAALATDYLETIARRVRYGNTNGWSRYWDSDGGKSPVRPQHEDRCRDSLLWDLRSELVAARDRCPAGRSLRKREARGYSVVVRRIQRAGRNQEECPSRALELDPRSVGSEIHSRPRVRWPRSLFGPVVW